MKFSNALHYRTLVHEVLQEPVDPQEQPEPTPLEEPVIKETEEGAQPEGDQGEVDEDGEEY